MAEFASKATSGVRRGLKLARVKSREAAEVVGIRRHIGSLEKERRAALEELGDRVLHMLEQGELDRAPLEPFRARLAELSQQIDDRKEELKTVHEQASEELE